MNPARNTYDYTNTGIDGFLSRSIDSVSWENTLDAHLNTLNNVPQQSTQLNYDTAQLSGGAGGVQSIGNMTLDPVSNAMTLNDGTIQING